MTLMMTSAQVVETSVNVTNNSPSRDYSHPDDQTTQTTETPGFKPFTVNYYVVQFEILRSLSCKSLLFKFSRTVCHIRSRISLYFYEVQGSLTTEYRGLRKFSPILALSYTLNLLYTSLSVLPWSQFKWLYTCMLKSCFKYRV